MSTAASPGDTVHRLTRNGRDIQVRVLEVHGGPRYGHILIFGEPENNCLVRIHSRCLYGEALGSQDCDCGPELTTSLDLIQDAGAGILIYLEQEGRGAGLLAKAQGYHESERTGADTFLSYERLGYPADDRNYEHAAAGLRELGLTAVRLLTNNPEKIEQLEHSGITVTRIPLLTPPLSDRAAEYLTAKRLRRGHLLPTLATMDPPHRTPPSTHTTDPA